MQAKQAALAALGTSAFLGNVVHGHQPNGARPEPLATRRGTARAYAQVDLLRSVPAALRTSQTTDMVAAAGLKPPTGAAVQLAACPFGFSRGAEGAGTGPAVSRRSDTPVASAQNPQNYPTLAEKGACPALGSTLGSGKLTKEEIAKAAQRFGITEGLAKMLANGVFSGAESKLSLFEVGNKVPPQHRGSVAHDDDGDGEIEPRLEQQFRSHASNGSFCKDEFVGAFVARHREDSVSFGDAFTGHAEANLAWHALSAHQDGEGRLDADLAANFLFRYQLPQSYHTPSTELGAVGLFAQAAGTRARAAAGGY
jgi:hypothetical protein